MFTTKLVGAIFALALLAGCAGQTVTVNLAQAQAQATAAVADIQAVGANLVAQGAIDSATEAKIVQDVIAANTAFAAIKSGTVTDLQLAANVASALQAAVFALGPQVPPAAAAIINGAVAAVNAYVASVSANAG